MASSTNDEVMQKYKKYKTDIFVKMKRKMIEREILKNNSYNNADMLEQYTLFVDLISETLCETLSSDKILKDKNRTIIRQPVLESITSKISLGEAIKEIEQAKKDFEKNYNEIINQINILKSGIDGEEILYNRLKIIGDEILILRNVKHALEDFEVEHDMIIISEVGIFTIEIKNWNSDSYIDKKGYLISEKGQRHNIVEQAMRHKHHLERILKKHGKESIKVHPIIAWVNLKSDITNKFEHITVCNYNELEFEILNHEKYQGCYDAKEREDIYNILNNNKLPMSVHPVTVNKIVVIEALSKIIAAICIPHRDLIRERTKKYEKSKKSESGLDIILKILDLIDHFLY